MQPPLAVIELDAFCERCGFNLRSQPVWRDEPLGLLVCRCPECGAHQSAVSRSTALTPWLNRLAVLAALVWVALGLSFAVALLVAFFGLQALAFAGLTNQLTTTPDGQPVVNSFINGGPVAVRLDARDVAIDGKRLVHRRMLIPLLGGPSIDPSAYGSIHDLTGLDVSLTTLPAALCTYSAGALLSAGCWFWRQPLRYLWLALPVLAAGLTHLTLLDDGMSGYFRTIGYQVDVKLGIAYAIVAGAVAAEIAVLAIGLATGRRLIRGVLLVFCPPGIRQLFAFLWQCDGKAMPVTATGTAPS